MTNLSEPPLSPWPIKAPNRDLKIPRSSRQVPPTDAAPPNLFYTNLARDRVQGQTPNELVEADLDDEDSSSL
jgi:hypothetical protein